LLNITEAINQNLPTENLLSFYKETLAGELNIGRFLLFSNVKGNWDVILYYGVDLYDFQSIDFEKDLLPITDIEITIGKNNKFMFFDFVIPIYKDNEVIAYVLMGDIDNEEIGLSPSLVHLQFIQTLTNIIMVAIQNKDLMKKSLEQERMKKELEMAAQIQSMLVPSVNEMPNLKQILIRTFYQPHFEVGGDLFDVGEINKNEFYFCIADVSGKGISAAMIMSNFQANLRAQFKTNSKLEDIVNNLNSNVVKVSEGLHFVTMFIAKYNTLKQRLIYVNAGHNPPIFYDYHEKRISDLNIGCQGIGMLDTIPNIQIGKVRIRNKSKILCFTDGLSEYSIDNINDFGYFIAKEAMLKEETSLDNTFDYIIEKLSLNKQNKNIFDDVTLLGIEISPENLNLLKKFRV
jgi:sigma-B regulation protein RsbU (phosphoserine phosphatase)